MTRRELIDYCLTYLAAYEDYPFDSGDAHSDDGSWTVIRHRTNKKGFAHIYERNGKLCINLKCVPFEADFLRQVYTDVTPGWHMNKVHWNTVTLDGDVPEDELRRMIGRSYDLIKPKVINKRENVVNIKIMTINDYEQVYDLWLNTPGMGLNTLDDSKDGISKYLLRNPNTCFIAEKDGVVLGVILCGHDGRRGYIHHTAVKETEQRSGIGTALLEAAMSALEREGISKAALVVFSKNEKGNAFWEKQGFTTREDLVYRNKAIASLTRIDT